MKSLNIYQIFILYETFGGIGISTGSYSGSVGSTGSYSGSVGSTDPVCWAGCCSPIDSGWAIGELDNSAGVELS